MLGSNSLENGCKITINITSSYNWCIFIPCGRYEIITWMILCFSDFGFDPLGLGAVPENLERFKESELIHCRWAMLAVVSISPF